MAKRLPDISDIKPPADPKATVTIRMPAAHRDALDELGRRKRMETGDNWTSADLIREAIAQYLDREMKPSD